MLRTVTTVLFSLLLVTKLSGQDIHGIVLDQQSQPIDGAYLLVGDKWQAVTNEKGEFVLTGVHQGKFAISASCLGYASWSDTVILNPSSSSPDLELAMEETIMGLPEVVVRSVSLTGGLKGLREVPGSAHYIGPKELERFSYTDINRVLQAVPGINLQEEDGFGLRPNIGLRGTGSERSSKITVMEDGILAAPAPYSAPAAYYFPTIGRMNAVEVLKGSSQIRFGPHTTGGALNLISTPIPNRFKGQLNFAAGSYGNRNMHAFAGNSHDRIGYMIETFQYQSDGFKQMDRGQTGFDKKDFLAKFRIHSRKDARHFQSLTLKVGQSDESSDETYLGLTAPDFNHNPFTRYAASQVDKMNTRHRQYALQHIIEISKAVDITTHLYRNDFHRNWYKLDKVNDLGGAVSIADILSSPHNYRQALASIKGEASKDNALTVKANNRDYRSEGVQTNIGFNLTTGIMKHRTDIGIRYHQDEVDRFQWVDGYRMQDGVMFLTQSGVAGTESNRLEYAKAWASYLQHKAVIGRWTIIPGLRFENIRSHRLDYGKSDPTRSGIDLSLRDNYVQVWIPGIGVDFKLNPDLALFGGVHKGFSPPGTRPGSLPEKSINYEVGLRLQGQGLSSQLIGFVSEYNNLLGSDLAAAGGSGSNDLFNGGSVSTRGMEMQVTYDLLKGDHGTNELPVTIVYTLTDATFNTSFDSEFEGWGTVTKGDALPYLAKHQWAISASMHTEKLSINLSTRYQSAMLVSAGTFTGTGSKIEGYALADLNTTYAFGKNLVLYINVTNLFDKKYAVAARPAGLRPGLPRNLMAGLKVQI